MSGTSLQELLQRKNVRIGLGVFCVFMAIVGTYQLLNGARGDADLLRGVGNLLVWSAFALSNFCKAFNRHIGGLNIAINVGIVMIVVGWIMMA